MFEKLRKLRKIAFHRLKKSFPVSGHLIDEITLLNFVEKLTHALTKIRVSAGLMMNMNMRKYVYELC